MKLLGRNMKFWLIQTGKMTMSMLVGFLITVFILMMGLEHKNFMEIVTDSLPAYMMVVLFIQNLTIVFGGVETLYPLCISMGSDRKSGFIAMVFSQHLFMLVVFAIAVLPACFSWFNGEWIVWLLLMFCPLLAASFLIMGISMLSSVAILKFGRGVGVSIYIGIYALVAVVGIMLILSTSDGVGSTVGLGESADLMLEWAPLVAAPMVTALFDALMTGALYRYIRKSDLRFA